MSATAFQIDGQQKINTMPYPLSLKLTDSHEFSHLVKSGSTKILPRQIIVFLLVILAKISYKRQALFD